MKDSDLSMSSYCTTAQTLVLLMLYVGKDLIGGCVARMAPCMAKVRASSFILI